MARRAEGWRRSLVLRVLLALVPSSSVAHAQADSKPEALESLDPYTRGERQGLDAAGYLSLGPFPWCAGITTREIERELGGLPILWVETEHFRIGSTLATYKLPPDKIERKRVAEELARIRELFPGAKIPAGKLDPWLRLHLYASRIESVHADFLRAFGLSGADFGAGQEAIAPGPHLGMPEKHTVFLAERRSTLARLVRYTARRDAQDPLRERLPGDTLFFGISAEAVESWGYSSDSALHAQVAANVALNLAFGFRGMTSPLPVWFEYGWSHVASRKVDERYTLYARSTLREDVDSWKWAARVAGLVSNGFAPTWEELASERRFEDLSGPDHLVAWSKVVWMQETFGSRGLRAFLLGVTDPVPRIDGLDPHEYRRGRQLEVLAEIGAGTLEQLEDSWRRWATKGGSRR